MSLREAIFDIAERMDKTADEFDRGRKSISGGTWRSFAAELRIILKVDKGDFPVMQGQELPRKFQEQQIRKFQREAEEAAVTLKREEQGVITAEFVEEDGLVTYVPIDSAMPIGAKIMLAGTIYQLQENRKLVRIAPEKMS